MSELQKKRWDTKTKEEEEEESLSKKNSEYETVKHARVFLTFENKEIEFTIPIYQGH